MSGPLFGKNDQLQAGFAESDQDLFKWMQDALENNKPVVYISLGSMCAWN